MRAVPVQHIDVLARRLTDAGFSADRAQWILRREEELALELIHARVDAERSDTPMSPEQQLEFDPAMRLRQELGDADFERYRVATGQALGVYLRRWQPYHGTIAIP